jgi:hypothetical protein
MSWSGGRGGLSSPDGAAYPELGNDGRLGAAESGECGARHGISRIPAAQIFGLDSKICWAASIRATCNQSNVMRAVMRVIKVVAVYPEDEKQRIVFIGRQGSDGKLDETSEYFGYVEDWNNEREIYLRYPFTMGQLKDQNAILDWGGWDFETKTIIDVFLRRIVPGERITRTENTERWDYLIKDITALV